MRVYKGFEIREEFEKQSGKWVLGGRYFKEGGMKKVFYIYKNDKRVFKCPFQKISEVKQFVDIELS